jgi:hypothetical protein
MSAMLKRREPPSAQFKEDADEEYAATGAGDDDDAFLAAAAAATDAVASQSPAKKAKAGDVRTLTAEKNDEGELFFSVRTSVGVRWDDERLLNVLSDCAFFPRPNGVRSFPVNGVPLCENSKVRSFWTFASTGRRMARCSRARKVGYGSLVVVSVAIHGFV